MKDAIIVLLNKVNEEDEFYLQTKEGMGIESGKNGCRNDYYWGNQFYHFKTKIMNRKLKAPPKPTKEETAKLERCIWMADWHFEETIKKKCTEIASYCVHWEKDDWKRATVYGLKAVKGEAKEPCIANLFIRYGTRVYQTNDLEKVPEIIKLLNKEKKYEEYEDKIAEQKYKERQKIIAQKQKQKGKVRKLKVAGRKKAA